MYLIRLSFTNVHKHFGIHGLKIQNISNDLKNVNFKYTQYNSIFE